MSEMVQRVAEAIFAIDSARRSEDGLTPFEWGDMTTSTHFAYRRMAEAAIAAMPPFSLIEDDAYFSGPLTIIDDALQPLLSGYGALRLAAGIL